MFWIDIGELSEWLKEHAWKVCIRETVSRVRIPHSPPREINPREIVGLFFSQTEPSLLERGAGKRINEDAQRLCLLSLEATPNGLTSEASNPQRLI